MDNKTIKMMQCHSAAIKLLIIINYAALTGKKSLTNRLETASQQLAKNSWLNTTQ